MDPHYFGKLDPDPGPTTELKAGSGSAFNSKFKFFRCSKWSRRGLLTLKWKARRLKWYPEGSNEKQDMGQSRIRVRI
jgi:hypothetical protein